MQEEAAGALSTLIFAAHHAQLNLVPASHHPPPQLVFVNTFPLSSSSLSHYVVKNDGSVAPQHRSHLHTIQTFLNLPNEKILWIMKSFIKINRENRNLQQIKFLHNS